MVRVVQVKFAYSADVCADSNLVIGDALSRPYTTNLFWPFAEYFEDPDFVLVGNGKAFATIAVTIFLDETAHQLYCLSCCRASLQGDALKFLNHEESLLVSQSVATANGCFAHCQLLFVQARISCIEETISMSGLRNSSSYLDSCHVVSMFGVHQTFVDVHDGVARVVLCGFDAHPCPVPRVASVARHDRAVNRGILAHHNAGTGIS